MKGKREYQVLIVARALINGIKDKIIYIGQMNPKLQSSFLKIWPNIPERGIVMSSPETAYLKRAAPYTGKKDTLDSWFKSNKTFVDDFYSNIKEASKLLWAKQLLGWPEKPDITKINEEIHDCVLSEFAWEFLY